MTSFQIALAMLAGLLFALIVAWETWRTRRRAPRRADPDSQLDDAPDTVPDVEHDLEPGFIDSRTPLPAEAAAERAARTPRPQLDALIDLIVPITLPEGKLLSGEVIQSCAPTARRIGSKMLAVEARNAHTGRWEEPISGQRYKQVQIGVQLADRQGALNEIEFSSFAQRVDDLADALEVHAQLPDMRHVITRARELDEFAAEHDAQLHFIVRAGAGAWTEEFVRQQLKKIGFAARSTGRWALPSDTAHVPLLLAEFDASGDQVDRISLLLNPAHIRRDEQPFDALCQVADRLAQATDGSITDDAGQILSAESLEPIRADLEHLYDTLELNHFPAGSPQAGRLFS